MNPLDRRLLLWFMFSFYAKTKKESERERETHDAFPPGEPAFRFPDPALLAELFVD